MKYERLTKRAGWHKDIDLTQELGYSYIYQRLSELENKIEGGELIELEKPYIKPFACKNSGKYIICKAQEVGISGVFPDKAEAEKKLKELKRE